MRSRISRDDIVWFVPTNYDETELRLEWQKENTLYEWDEISI
ncbi:hypothetical protein [Sodalis sp.]